MNHLRQRFEALSLSAQHVWLQCLAGLLLALLCHLLLDASALWLGSVLLLTVLGTVLHGGLGQRTARALLDITVATQKLRRSQAQDDLNFQRHNECAELQRASLALRRLVEVTRKRQRVLMAHAAALGQRLELRTHELATLQNLSIGLANTTDMHELIDEALGALEQTMAYASASVWSREEQAPQAGVVLMGYRSSDELLPIAEDLRGMRLSRQNLQRYEQIEREGQPVVENRVRQSLLSWLWSFVSDDARSSELYRGTRAWMAVPLKSRDDVLGVLRVDHTEPDYFDVERMRLLSAVGSQTGLAMRHAQLLAQQQELAVLAERARLARELHDAVSQTLFAANIIAGTLATLAQRGDPDALQRLRQQALALERLNRGALAEMRLLMFELKPEAMEKTPLAELIGHAIEALSCRSELVVERRLAREDQLSATIRIQIYRIVQEALSNIARHSGATQVVVEWKPAGPGAGFLRVADDGCGFDTHQSKPGHFGLSHMAERAADIGARFSLSSTPGEGTEIRLELVPSNDPV